VVGASSQLELLSIGTILRPGIGEAVQPDWTVLNRDLGDN